MHMFSFFFKQKNLITTLKFNPSFSNYGQKDPFASSLASSYSFHVHIDSFCLAQTDPSHEFTLFCDLSSFVGGIFKEWSRSTPRPLKGGGQNTQKKRGLFTHLLPHLRNEPTYGS
jgi:hypothetical protein